MQSGITDGAYWLRKPGPNAEVVIAYTGAVAPEAIEAVGLLGESRRDVGLLAITSADRLHAGWTAARKLRRDRRGVAHLSHIEKLLAPLPRDCGIVTVIDGHPAALGWLGSVRGHRVEALGVEHFGQTGTIDDLYRHHGIDANAIIDAAEALTVGATNMGNVRYTVDFRSVYATVLERWLGRPSATVLNGAFRTASRARLA